MHFLKNLALTRSKQFKLKILFLHPMEDTFSGKKIKSLGIYYL
jgi:hypothetical protein